MMLGFVSLFIAADIDELLQERASVVLYNT